MPKCDVLKRNTKVYEKERKSHRLKVLERKREKARSKELKKEAKAFKMATKMFEREQKQRSFEKKCRENLCKEKTVSRYIFISMTFLKFPQCIKISPYPTTVIII